MGRPNTLSTNDQEGKEFCTTPDNAKAQEQPVKQAIGPKGYSRVLEFPPRNVFLFRAI